MDTLHGIHLTRVIVALVLVGVGPFLDLKSLRRLKETCDGELRLRWYRCAVPALWATGIVCFGLIGFHGLIHLPGDVIEAHAGWAVPKTILSGVTVGLSVGLLMPGMLSLFNPRMQAAYGKAYVKAGLVYLLPIGQQQRRWWAVLSLTAGICEELIFRGFVLTVLRIDLHQGMILALLASSLAFGWAHLYQGISGILKAGMMGLLLAIAAFATGGLLLPIVLHSLIDLQVLAIYRPPLESTLTAQAI